MVEIVLHPGWIGHRVNALEEATGTRVAYLMRFGLGTLPTASTVLQEGDQVFMLVTDDIAETVTAIAGTAPEGSK
jgi:trk system potassium uptake protein TrkA